LTLVAFYNVAQPCFAGMSDVRAAGVTASAKWLIPTRYGLVQLRYQGLRQRGWAEHAVPLPHDDMRIAELRHGRHVGQQRDA